MATAGTLEYLISVDSSQVNSGLTNAENKVKNTGNKLSQWAVAKGQVIGRMIERAGAATVSFVKNSVQESMSFNKSMAQVAATLGKSTTEIKTLTNFARKMGSETAFTAEQAAQGLNYMALAGYDAKKSMQMLPQVLNLAAAGNFDLARASDMVTDAQSALGLSTKKTEVLIDQMAKSASITNTSVEQLGDAILTVGGTAKMMKGGTKELTATLGVLADSGIKGSEGGTALRNVLLSLSAPTDKAAKQLKQLGVNVFDAKGNMKSLPAIMQSMNKAMKGMSQKERTSFLNDIFNKRDLKAVEALLGTSKKKWKELYAEISGSKGSAKKMAETQLDNLAGDVTKFKSALGETKLTIVEGLTPALRKLTQTATSFLTKVTKAFKKNGIVGAVKKAHSFLKKVRQDLMQSAKTNIAKYLGLGDKASWTDIAHKAVLKLKDGLKNAFKKGKVKIAELLHVPNAKDATWGKIARQLVINLKNGLKNVKVTIAELLNIPNAGDASWVDIASNIANRLKAGFQNTKVLIADLLNIPDAGDASWGDIASTIATRLLTGIQNTKIKIAELLNIPDAGDASWADIAGNIISRIKSGIGTAKMKIAELLDIPNAGDASWADIASNIASRIKDGIGTAKVKIAELLDVPNAEDASWADIASNIASRIKTGIGDAKVKIAELLNVPEPGDASWTNIAKNITSRIKTGMSNAKIKMAELLHIPESKDATWTGIAAKISLRIKSGFQNVKVKIADLLNIPDSGDASWSTIASNISERIKSGLKNAKIKIAELLNIPEAGEATWTTIAGDITSRLNNGIDKARIKIADLLDLPADGENTWSDIAGNITTRLKNGLGAGNKFLKALILGKDYKEGQSTWTDIARSLSEQVSKAFEDGGILGMILGNVADKTSAIITFAGDLVTGIAEWVASPSNTNQVVSIFTSLFDAVAKAAPALAKAIGKVFAQPDFWNSIFSGLSNISYSLLEGIFGKNVANTIKRIFGVEIPGEISSANAQEMERTWSSVLINGFTDKNEKQVAAKWNDFVTDIFKKSKIDNSKYNAFMDIFSFDNLQKAMKKIGKNKFWDAFNEAIKSFNEGDTEGAKKKLGIDVPLEPDMTKVEEADGKELNGTYKMTPDLTSVEAANGKTLHGTYVFTPVVNTPGEGNSTKSIWKRYHDGGLSNLGGGNNSGSSSNRPVATNAKGNWYVPYDNYPTLLHRGEMVLNKSQARNLRDGYSDDSGLGRVINEAVTTAMSRVYVMLNGDKVGDLTTKRINKNINASSYNKLRALGG